MDNKVYIDYHAAPYWDKNYVLKLLPIGHIEITTTLFRL